MVTKVSPLRPPGPKGHLLSGNLPELVAIGLAF